MVVSDPVKVFCMATGASPRNQPRVKIAAADKADGYEIAYSKSVTFKDAKTKAVDAFKTKTKTVKINGLEKNEAYFMQACSYIKVGKVKYYSAPGKVVLSVKIN